MGGCDSWKDYSEYKPTNSKVNLYYCKKCYSLISHQFCVECNIEAVPLAKIIRRILR